MMKLRAAHLFILCMGLLSNMAWTMGQPILILLPVALAVIAQFFDMQERNEKEKVKKNDTC